MRRALLIFTVCFNILISILLSKALYAGEVEDAISAVDLINEASNYETRPVGPSCFSRTSKRISDLCRAENRQKLLDMCKSGAMAVKNCAMNPATHQLVLCSIGVGAVNYLTNTHYSDGVGIQITKSVLAGSGVASVITGKLNQQAQTVRGQVSPLLVEGLQQEIDGLKSELDATKDHFLKNKSQIFEKNLEPLEKMIQAINENIESVISILRRPIELAYKNQRDLVVGARRDEISKALKYVKETMAMPTATHIFNHEEVEARKVAFFKDHSYDEPTKKKIDDFIAKINDNGDEDAHPKAKLHPALAYFFGEPGVGKSSIGFGIAKIQGLTAHSLDVAELKTTENIKARLIEILKTEKRNPIIMLDEMGDLFKPGPMPMDHQPMGMMMGPQIPPAITFFKTLLGSNTDHFLQINPPSNMAGGMMMGPGMGGEQKSMMLPTYYDLSRVTWIANGNYSINDPALKERFSNVIKVPRISLEGKSKAAKNRLTNLLAERYQKEFKDSDLTEDDTRMLSLIAGHADKRFDGVRVMLNVVDKYELFRKRRLKSKTPGSLGDFDYVSAFQEQEAMEKSPPQGVSPPSGFRRESEPNSPGSISPH